MLKTWVSVLTTVNAPYSEQLDASSLAHCLKDIKAAKSKPGHMSCFFGEVAVSDQIAFANAQNVTPGTLKYAAHAFAEYSGESYPLNA